MEEITDWRQWIKSLDPDEKKKLAAYLEMDKSSLSYWVHRHKVPRPNRIQQLETYNPALRAALESEFPDAFKEEVRIRLQIPTAFYEDILATFAYTAFSVSDRTIARKVFESMCYHLDPAETGFLIIPVLLQSDPLHDDDLITIMRSSEGCRTGVFHIPRDNEYYEIGRDSLAGIAVQRRRVVIYPQTGILAHCPIYPSELIASAAAFPLWRRGRLAGSLFVASVHADFFTVSRVELCTRYADLYTLSLYDDQFYDPLRIDLRVMREDMQIPETNGAS